MIFWTTAGNLLSQWYQVKRWQKFCIETFKKVFSNPKRASSNILLCEFFHVYVMNKYHTVFFSFNLKLICTCKFFKKLKLHSLKRLVQFQFFWKTQKCKLLSNWSINRMITYTNITSWCCSSLVNSNLCLLVRWQDFNTCSRLWFPPGVNRQSVTPGVHSCILS